MNCQDFQERLFEYLDGTLSTRTRQGLDQHLASCHICRQLLAKHQLLAGRLSDQLCQSVESLTLDSVVRRRVLAALPTRAAPAPGGRSLAHLWRRFAWPVGIACLLGAGLVLSNHFPGASHERPRTAPRLSSAPVPVSIRVSRLETTYTFRKEGQFVTDAFVRRTNLIHETFWAEVPSRPVPKGSVNKFSL